MSRTAFEPRSSTASRSDMVGVSRAVRGQSNYGIVTATSATQLVGGVEGRDLVALGEGRIVEDRLEKIVEPAAQGEDGLADVNQLRGAGPQAVHGEQPPILAMKEHLEEAAPVAKDLAAGDLAIPRDAGLVRYARGGQLVLRRTHHRNLGDRVDADGKVAGHRSRFDSEGLARGQPALLRGRGRETRISDDVAGREDVRHRRPEGVVDLEPTEIGRASCREGVG